jgi:hypothetical protein
MEGDRAVKRFVSLLVCTSLGAVLGCQTGRNCDDGCCAPSGGSCQLHSAGTVYGTYPAAPPHGAAAGEHLPGPAGGGVPAPMPMPQPYDDAPAPAGEVPGPPIDAALLPRL